MTDQSEKQGRGTLEDASTAAPPAGKAAREAKLAAALRTNLVRRKAAARAAQAGAGVGGTPGRTSEKDDEAE